MRRNPFADLRVLQLEQGVNNAMNYDRSCLKAALIRIKINVVVFFSPKVRMLDLFFTSPNYMLWCFLVVVNFFLSRETPVEMGL